MNYTDLSICVNRCLPDLLAVGRGEAATGGVAPVGQLEPLRTIVDIALSNCDVLWAAGGHTHGVFTTSYDELLAITGGEAAEVGD